jgi:predicted ATP-grasp superfamily ATP-dependent carboligase
MPFALALIRKLAEEGHEVYASDAYAFAPGSHSRFVTEHFVTAAPRDATEAFIADVARIANEHEIELIVPSFEEAFYLSTRHNLLAEDARLFFAPFATLAPLHDKASFERLAVHMGLPMAATVLATSDAELREGLERFPRLRDPAPVEALHRHPVHVPRRRRDARARPEDRGGDRVHRADLLRLHRVTGRGGACRVQPARHRRRAADGL